MNVIKPYVYVISIIIIASTHSVMLYANEPPPLFSHTLFSDTFTLSDNFESVYFHTLKEHINSLQPNLGVEVYYNFSLPQSVIDTLSNTEIDRILFETLMSFNTQEGIEYYSHRRQAYRIFILESYTVQSLLEKEKQPDMKLSDATIPAEKSLYVYQNDSSFGKGIKRILIQYDRTSSQFFMDVINEEQIKYQGLIKIAEPKSLVLNLLINRSGKNIQAYGICATHTKILPFLRKRISISMAYRVFALAKWFEQESINTLLKK